MSSPRCSILTRTLCTFGTTLVLVLGPALAAHGAAPVDAGPPQPEQRATLQSNSVLADAYPQIQGAPAGPPAVPAHQSWFVLPTRPQDVADICSVLIPASCNSVVSFDTRNPAVSQPAWNDYNCVNHSVFLANSLVYSETGYTVSLGQVRDLSLAVPLVMTQSMQMMNVFAGLFTDCSNGACIAGSENKMGAIYRHAIQPSAPAGSYDAILDSDNMAGIGDMIVACGNPNPGWCSGVVRQDLGCGDYVIDDTTAGAPDDITYYVTNYWAPSFAYDGPERVYRIQLSGARVVSITLEYDGNPALPYNSYMSYYILGSDCNQRDAQHFPRLPEALFVGETGRTRTGGVHRLAEGTHYLVVDGMHLPQGDDFRLTVHCQGLYVPFVQHGP